VGAAHLLAIDAATIRRLTAQEQFWLARRAIAEQTSRWKGHGSRRR